MLLLRSNGTLLHMKDCIITFVKLIISKKHNFILYNALTNRDSPNFPLPSNPLPQIVTSNPRLQPDTHFAVDMFPYKKTGLFQKSGFKSKLPKKPGIYVFLFVLRHAGCATEAKLPTLIHGIRRIQPIA